MTEKIEVLTVLSIIRDIGCCNMFDRSCIVKALKLVNENKVANYINSLSSQDYYSLLSQVKSEYLRVNNGSFS